MNEKKAKELVVFVALILILSGAILYYVFDRQGYDKKASSNYVNYNKNDYVVITPVNFGDYGDFYNSLNISKIEFKNIDDSITKDFINSEDEIINYISDYYNSIMPKEGYTPNNSAKSTIKAQINGATLSVYYNMYIDLDENLFEDHEKNYFITTNIDLGTKRTLTTEDLLSKYNYTKKYISEKIFDEDVLIKDGEVVVDKNTNISLTKQDVEKKKDEYVNRIINDFNNIIKVYIENNYLTLVYDKKELNALFFDNEFDTDVKIRYLK